MRQHRQRDRPTCRQCPQHKYCIESSRMYPCSEFSKRKKMSDGQLAVEIIKTGVMFGGMVAIYIARA